MLKPLCFAEGHLKRIGARIQALGRFKTEKCGRGRRRPVSGEGARRRRGPGGGGARGVRDRPRGGFRAARGGLWRRLHVLQRPAAGLCRGGGSLADPGRVFRADEVQLGVGKHVGYSN